jgi:hypothetical protein
MHNKTTQKNRESTRIDSSGVSLGKQEFRRTDFGRMLLAAECEGSNEGEGEGTTGVGEGCV